MQPELPKSWLLNFAVSLVARAMKEWWDTIEGCLFPSQEKLGCRFALFQLAVIAYQHCERWQANAKEPRGQTKKERMQDRLNEKDDPGIM